MSRVMLSVTALCIVWQSFATAAPFDVYFRPDPSARWTLYGGRESRAAAEASAADLQRLGGYETTVAAGGQGAPRELPGDNASAAFVPANRAIAVGGTTYVARPGQGYVPGWYRHWGGWGGGWRGGWGSGYGGHAGSWDHHHGSSHHHHHSHESHHAGHSGTNHPAHTAGGRAGSAGHHSASHHSHSHSHSHSHHSHAGHHGHGGHRK